MEASPTCGRASTSSSTWRRPSRRKQDSSRQKLRIKCLPIRSSKATASRWTDMRFGVVVFPGSNCDEDAYHAAKAVFGQDAEYLWHKDTDLKGAEVLILPGGFAHGDYLRTGAMARFAPIMPAVRAFAERGGPVLGICNGFQILLEAGLLPGAMLRNRGLQYRCEHVYLRVEQN